MHSDVFRTLVAIVAAAVPIVVPAHAAAQGSTTAATTSTWTAPRTADGQPDLQGVWRYPLNTAVYSYDIEAPAPAEAYPGRDLVATFKPIIVDPPDGKIPYQPWAREKREYLYKAAFRPRSLQELDPQALCIPGGPPRMSYQGAYQILQTPEYVVFLYEFTHLYRVVPLDGRRHLTDKVKLFMGDSRGRWEGETLVIEVTNNNGRNWLDVAGDFHTDAFRVVERWTRVAPDELRYEATMDDPNVYTRPWKMVISHLRRPPGYQLLEEACHEGNRVLSELIAAPDGQEE